ncbi:MAG: archease [Candidatus Ancaeobacter aquaticus]|nr:archease [Candidatus Ancaeobacter aquaticus]
MNNEKPYTFNAHTADISMTVTAKSYAELFLQAACGLALQIFPEKVPFKNSIEKEINLHADTIEDLFVDWLNDILYLFYTEHMLFESAKIEFAASINLSAKCIFNNIAVEDRKYAKEIKAATYHNLKITHENYTYKTEVILDV